MRAVRIRALTVALLILALAPLERAAAQDFPTRPVRFVVPYAAGGSGDLLARLLGNKLASIWGQQVVIDNRPGAGGLIGTDFAVLVPGGTPPAIVGKLSAEIAQVVADPEFKNALAVRGFEAQASAPEQLADFLGKDYVKFRDLIQRLGLQVE